MLALLPPENLWIPVTLFAAFAQTIRNAAQKHLIASLGTMGATLVRFLYGLPFACLWLVGVHEVGGYAYPSVSWAFIGWIALGALGQVGGTALLLKVVAQRNFTLGVAYTKTEALQVALLGFVLLGDPMLASVIVAVVLGTVGVLLMSPPDPHRPLRALIRGFTERVALLGLASGTCFSMAAVGYRGGALALEGVAFPMAAAFGLVDCASHADHPARRMAAAAEPAGRGRRRARVARFAVRRLRRRRRLGGVVHRHGDRADRARADAGFGRAAVRLRHLVAHLSRAPHREGNDRDRVARDRHRDGRAEVNRIRSSTSLNPPASRCATGRAR